MRPLVVPDAIRHALERGAALAISVSGGKDSQAMLRAVARHFRERGYRGRLLATHADLGRAEWGGHHPTSPLNTLRHVRRMCEAEGVELLVVQRAKGDLVDRWRDRLEQLAGQGKPHWSSAASRYCTSDLKREPIDKFLRSLGDLVISAEGIRAGESRNRATKPCWEPRKRIETQTREALTWRPIHEWSEGDVWEALGSSLWDLERRRALYRAGFESLALSGWPGHPAYVLGNERLSCALCVLAGRNDLENGIRHNPELAEEIMRQERESGFGFKKDLSIIDLVRQMDAA